jgi:hypothetical protein
MDQSCVFQQWIDSCILLMIMAWGGSILGWSLPSGPSVRPWHNHKKMLARPWHNHKKDVGKTVAQS